MTMGMRKGGKFITLSNRFSGPLNAVYRDQGASFDHSSKEWILPIEKYKVYSRKCLLAHSLNEFWVSQGLMYSFVTRTCLLH